ncbi:MAG: hypothetical protein R3F56_18125 [Planctomycetota bacterium]
MLPLAAFLTGFGGLLLELAWLRRYGLLLGNTAAALGEVFGVYLAGIGCGGFLAARWRAATVRPLLCAGRLYLLVALSGFLAEPLLRARPTLPAGWAQAALLLVPGLPALGMGVAFPLLFAALPRAAGTLRTGWRNGLLNASNLAGAMAGAFLGGNVCVPEMGLLRSGQLGGLAYLLAAATVLFAARSAGRDAAVGLSLPPPPRLQPARGDLGLAFGGGALLLGCEVLWLRRLPFFLEGFQPTLAGVVAAVLLWNAVGAALVTPLLARLAGARAPLLAALLALLAASLGLHEWGTPALMRLPVDTTAGMHGRIFLGASIAAALPCVFLGALVPLLLAPALHPETRGALAGALFGAQGLGELAGALLVGHLLPWLLPSAYFAAVPAVLGCLVLLLWRRSVGWAGTSAAAVVLAVLALLGVSGAGTPLAPRPPALGARYDRPLVYRHLTHAVDATLTASVAYDRRGHSMVLFTDEFRATETGPSTAYMRVLGHLPFLLRTGLRRVAVIALGTGTTLEAVGTWPDPQAVDVVELSPAVVRVAPVFTADGPVADGRPPCFARDPRVHLHVTDGRAYLARCAPASLDLVTMEPLLPYAPGTSSLYSAEFYALARRALSDRGLLVQWLPSHAMPRTMFDTLLQTVVCAFPHVSVWLVDQSTLVVGSRTPHLPDPSEAEARLRNLSGDVVAALHDAGVVGVQDLLAALVCADASAAPALGSAQVLTDDAPFLERLDYWSGETRLGFLPDNLLRLAELAAADASADLRWREVRLRRLSGLRNLAQAPLPQPGAAALPRAVLDFDAARVRAERSVLLFREQGRALRALYETQIQRSPDLGAARAAAERLLRLDAQSALALAALALAAEDPAVRDRRGAEALALDPLVWATMPPALADLRLRMDFVSPREDLGRLPTGAALAAAACGDGARPVALRGTFGPRVARALCAVAAERPLAAAENGALRPVLDPFTWAAFADAVVARGGDVAAEVLPLWRRDLAATDALATLLRAAPPARTTLAAELGGRGDATACDLLAHLLVDADLGVRRAAAHALSRTSGGRIPYDAEASESARADAAAALRRLHNPPP